MSTRTEVNKGEGNNDGDAPVASISSSLIADNLDVRLTIPPIKGMMRRTWITLRERKRGVTESTDN